MPREFSLFRVYLFKVGMRGAAGIRSPGRLCAPSSSPNLLYSLPPRGQLVWGESCYHDYYFGERSSARWFQWQETVARPLSKTIMCIGACYPVPNAASAAPPRPQTHPGLQR